MQRTWKNYCRTHVDCVLLIFFFLPQNHEPIHRLVFFFLLMRTFSPRSQVDERRVYYISGHSKCDFIREIGWYLLASQCFSSFYHMRKNLGFFSNFARCCYPFVETCLTQIIWFDLFFCDVMYSHLSIIKSYELAIKVHFERTPKQRRQK